MIRVTVEGGRQLAHNLGQLERAISTRLTRAALRAGAQVGSKAIKRATYTTVQKRTGLLRAGMTVKAVKARQPMNRLAAGVYASKASGAFLKKASAKGLVRRRKLKAGDTKAITVPFYWRFIEFGTKRMNPRPYIAQAFSSVSSEMVAAFRNRLSQGIDREAAKLPK